MLIEKKIKERVMRKFFRTLSYPKTDAVDDLVTEDPFDYSPSWEKRFFDAMRFSFEHHLRHSSFYGKLCAYKKFDQDRLKSFDDIWDIPHILCDAFKFYDITTRTKNLLKIDMTSSGTSGRKSRIALNMVSGRRLLYVTYHTYRALGLVDAAKPVNYLMMAYNPSLDESRATTNSDVVIAHFAPKKDAFYVLDSKEGRGVEFLKDEAVDRLRDFVKDGSPIRVLGFLHHACEVIREYNKRYGKVEFPSDSYILSGGGWKNFGHLYDEDFDLFEFLKETTTIDPRNIRDLYTLNEHAVFYPECANHNMHIPNVALATSRDPRTLRRLKFGETGLIHLYAPLIESAPLLSVLTTDYGHIGESCDCPIGGPYIKIMGRAGVTKKTTCTLTADQYIKSAKEETVNV